MMRFFWKDVICRHDCLRRFIMNEESKNKKIVEALIKKYRIKRVVMLTYHSQMNELVKKDYTAVMNALIKISADEMKEWIRSLLNVLWADKIILKIFIKMISYHVLYDCNVILSIELDVSIWQILSWNKIHIMNDLLTLHAQQLECKDENLKKVMLHLRRMRKMNKNVWNDHQRIHIS